MWVSSFILDSTNNSWEPPINDLNIRLLMNQLKDKTKQLGFNEYPQDSGWGSVILQGMFEEENDITTGKRTKLVYVMF